MADPRRSHLDAPRESLHGERNISGTHVGGTPGPLAQASDRARSRMEAAYEGTVDKVRADYRPADTSERCGRCINGRFSPGETEGRCTIVAGAIAQGAVCEYFSAPTREHPVSQASQLAEPARADEEARGRERSSDTGNIAETRGVK